jgi:hypothetical protein
MVCKRKRYMVSLHDHDWLEVQGCVMQNVRKHLAQRVTTVQPDER